MAPIDPAALAKGSSSKKGGGASSSSSRKLTRTDTLASLTNATLDLYKSWLYKESPKSGKWSRLWCELYDDGIHCYTKKPRTGGKRKGVVSFDEETVTSVIARGLQREGRYVFVVVTQSREYAFASEAKDEYSIWLELLGEDYKVVDEGDDDTDYDDDDF